jgi:CHASE3 domain sensor protein
MDKLTTRKIALTFLFVLLLLCQFLIFRSWFSHHNTQENLSKSFSEIIKPNQSLFYSNEATKNFVDAGISFNEYLQGRDPKFLKEYQFSIDNMSIYLDSLSALSKTDKDFSKIINAKKGAEKKVSLLQEQLDALINQKIAGESVTSSLNFKIQSFKFYNV